MIKPALNIATTRWGDDPNLMFSFYDTNLLYGNIGSTSAAILDTAANKEFATRK